MIEGLHHVAVLASEKERTVSFYEALGFRVRECHVRPERRDEIVFMEQSGVTLEIFISRGNPPRTSNPEAYGLRHLALRAGNAQAVRRSLLSAGWQPEEMREDTFDGKAMFFVKDPDGLPIEIHE